MMKHCNQCGAEFPDSAKFCGKCGGDLIDLPGNASNEQDRLGELLKEKKRKQDEEEKPQLQGGSNLFVWIGVALVALVGLLLGVNQCNKSSAPDEPIPIGSVEIDATKDDGTKREEDIAVFETKRIALKEEGDETTCELKADFPIKGSPDLLRAVRECINQTLRDALGDDCYDGDIADGERMLRHYIDAAASIPNNELDGEFEVIYETDKYVSFFYSIDSYEQGAAHPSEKHGGATFRKSDGTKVDWGMFVNDAHMQAMINKGMQDFYGEDKFHGDYIPFPETPPVLTNFGVKFYYQRYEMGMSYADGTPFFSISYSDIKGQMKPSVRELVE